jgi:hypothetical protein
MLEYLIRLLNVRPVQSYYSEHNILDISA